MSQWHWSTVVKDGEVWGWRLYNLDQEWRPIRATVRPLLCKTKKSVGMWLTHVEHKGKHRMFYTDEEAKAFALAMVRME